MPKYAVDRLVKTSPYFDTTIDAFAGKPFARQTLEELSYMSSLCGKLKHVSDDLNVNDF